LDNKDRISMIGAGLAGPVMAKYLSEYGYEVDIFERRSDLRVLNQSAGRSINLALSARGIKALKDIDVFEKIKSTLLPMQGRMIHDQDGKTHMQLYGQKEDEVIYSVSRENLNKVLMDHAENTGKVNFHFDHKLLDVDLNNCELNFENVTIPFNRLLGVDGSSSIVRKSIEKKTPIKYKKKSLEHGYKELTIPPNKNGGFMIEKTALHIWPRGEFMLIALPNMDGSFTCTLFLPLDGILSFASIQSKNEILNFFKSYFPDALDLIPNLYKEYKDNPLGRLATIYCDKWNYKSTAAILGDAAHAIVPFFGQGMNASFQDCTVMNSLIKIFNDDWEKIFSEFSSLQVPNGHAIANMAIENYIEMRDSVNNPHYKERRELELYLENKFWNKFVPRYSMVSFHEIPYAQVYNRGKIQFDLMDSYISGNLTKNQLYDKIKKQLTAIR